MSFARFAQALPEWANVFGLWLGTFVNVLLLGVQSRNVNAGHYSRAALCSFALVLTNLVYIRAATLQPVLFVIVAGTAGPTGICTAIWLTKHIKRVR